MGYLNMVNECVNMKTQVGSYEWKQQMLQLGIREEDIEKVIEFNQRIQINMSGTVPKE